jgi:hypothetical protein
MLNSFYVVCLIPDSPERQNWYKDVWRDIWDGID